MRKIRKAHENGATFSGGPIVRDVEEDRETKAREERL